MNSSEATEEQRNRVGIWRSCTLVVILAILAIAGLFRIEEHKRLYARVPLGLEVDGVSYTKEKNWGIGMPGDNETGIIICRLSDDVAKALEKGGVRAIGRLGKQTGGPWTLHDSRRKRLYDKWIATPYTLRRCSSIRTGNEWTDDPKTCRFYETLDSYLGQYGFGIEIDPAVRDAINRALSISGNYYSHGRVGVFLIAPSQKMAAFFYAG